MACVLSASATSYGTAYAAVEAGAPVAMECLRWNGVTCGNITWKFESMTPLVEQVVAAKYQELYRRRASVRGTQRNLQTVQCTNESYLVCYFLNGRRILRSLLGFAEVPESPELEDPDSRELEVPDSRVHARELVNTDNYYTGMENFFTMYQVTYTSEQWNCAKLHSCDLVWAV